MSLNLIQRSCPACGSDRSRVIAEEKIDLDQLDGFAFASRKLPEYMHYRLVECSECDLAYANPAPDSSALGEAYREAEYDSAVEARCAARTYARLLPAIASRLRSTVGAMDIGAGDGAFMEELLSAGFSDVVGIEPSTAPILAAREHIKCLIQQGLFCSDDFADRQFSIITCLQTIEHVPDPGGMMRAINSLLADGGAVLIVCHNRKALSARALGKKSPIFDIEHLQLFSRESISNLLRTTGFVDIQVKTVINRYPLRYWAKLAPFPPGIKAWLLNTLQQGPVGAAKLPLPAGNLVAIGYKGA